MAYTEQDRRNHIRELQQYLYSLSFLDETLPRVIPDGIYGRQTALAVRAFQQKNGLRPNGETNRATWDAIVNAYRQQIQREATPLHLYTPERELLGAGETGLLVLVLQSILKTLGVRYTNIQNLQITGIYDAPTQKAVQNFQSLTARKPTGMVDRATWNYWLLLRSVRVYKKRVAARYEPQAAKSFSVQQFFKNAAEVWASSPHLRSKFNFVVWFSCCNCLRLEICSLSHKNSVCSAVHSCVRQICTCSADTPANDVNAVTIKFGLTLSGCPTDSIHSSTNAPAITCSA